MATSTSLPFSPSELSYTSQPLCHSKINSSSNSSGSYLRSDGRSPLAYRDIVLSNANEQVSQAQGALGSSIACLNDSTIGAGGESQVMAAVRGEIGPAILDDDDNDGQAGNTSQGRGNIIVTIECSPTALPSLRPDLLPHLASLLTSLFSPQSLPTEFLSQLIVIPRSKAWTLHLDILILSSLGGNIIDLSLMAARCALANTRLPRTRPVAYDATATDQPPSSVPGTILGDQDNLSNTNKDVGFSGLVKGGKAGARAMDFELIDQQSSGDQAGDRLKGWQDLPIGLSLNIIDQTPFLDATVLEESIAQSTLITCFDAQGQVTASKQIGTGEIELDRLIPLFKKAQSLSEDLRQALNLKLKDA